MIVKPNSSTTKLQRKVSEAHHTLHFKEQETCQYFLKHEDLGRAPLQGNDSELGQPLNTTISPLKQDQVSISSSESSGSSLSSSLCIPAKAQNRAQPRQRHLSALYSKEKYKRSSTLDASFSMLADARYKKGHFGEGLQKVSLFSGYQRSKMSNNPNETSVLSRNQESSIKVDRKQAGGSQKVEAQKESVILQKTEKAQKIKKSKFSQQNFAPRTQKRKLLSRGNSLQSKKFLFFVQKNQACPSKNSSGLKINTNQPIRRKNTNTSSEYSCSTKFSCFQPQKISPFVRRAFMANLSGFWTPKQKRTRKLPFQNGSYLRQWPFIKKAEKMTTTPNQQEDSENTPVSGCSDHDHNKDEDLSISQINSKDFFAKKIKRKNLGGQQKGVVSERKALLSKMRGISCPKIDFEANQITSMSETDLKTNEPNGFKSIVRGIFDEKGYLEHHKIKRKSKEKDNTKTKLRKDEEKKERMTLPFRRLQVVPLSPAWSTNKRQKGEFLEQKNPGEDQGDNILSPRSISVRASKFFTSKNVNYNRWNKMASKKPKKDIGKANKNIILKSNPKILAVFRGRSKSRKKAIVPQVPKEFILNKQQAKSKLSQKEGMKKVWKMSTTTIPLFKRFSRSRSYKPNLSNLVKKN